LITEKYPDAIFLPIETTGDGAINVYSRVQMMLFKAKQAAQKEFDEALSKKNLTVEQLQKIMGRSKSARPLQTSRHVVACTAANLVYGMRGFFNGFSFRRNKEEVQRV
ncbi:MAG: 2-hydroxyglutaryl-CoA dehydratase, partial [Paenibacillaceae bacterium]